MRKNSTRKSQIVIPRSKKKSSAKVFHRKKRSMRSSELEPKSRPKPDLKLKNFSKNVMSRRRRKSKRTLSLNQNQFMASRNASSGQLKSVKSLRRKKHRFMRSSDGSSMKQLDKYSEFLDQINSEKQSSKSNFKKTLKFRSPRKSTKNRLKSVKKRSRRTSKSISKLIGGGFKQSRTT
jgi:hypothetical protein